MDYTMNRRVRQPVGNAHPDLAPHGVYPCVGDDRWVAISVTTDQEWEALCRAMGNPEWSRHERFADALGRCRHREELDRLVAGWTRGLDQYAAMHLLQEAGVPAGAVLDNTQVDKDPHFVARGFFQDVFHPEMGTFPLPGVIWKMSKTPGSIRLRPPLFGEHNEYVFLELLGLSRKDYVKLLEEQYIGTVPLMDSPM